MVEPVVPPYGDASRVAAAAAAAAAVVVVVTKSCAAIKD